MRHIVTHLRGHLLDAWASSDMSASQTQHQPALKVVVVLSRYKVIDYGLADFEARYAAGMIGDAADHGTQSAPKEETHRQRKQREREAERDPGNVARRTLALRKNVIPSVSCKLHDKQLTEDLTLFCLVQQEHLHTVLVLSRALFCLGA